MNQADLLELARYNAWATDRVAPALADLPPADFDRRIESSFPSLRATLAHLIGVAILWHARWNGAQPRTILALEELPADGRAIAARWREADAAVLAFVEAHPDANHVYDITNTKGDKFRHTLAEMATHLVNHQSYHRGQVTTMLRTLGRKPQDQDYITYVRSR